MSNKVPEGDLEKTRLHLTLLREQYGRLQEKCVHLEQKLAASPAGAKEDSFLSAFFDFFCNLYEKEEYSDVTIRLLEGDIRAHRVVLAARGKFWGVASLADIDVLDWRELEKGVGQPLLRWIYTDNIHLVDHVLALKVARAAAQFKLEPLIKRCESALIGWVNVKNCIQMYTTAEEICAPTLKNHCSTLISTYWNDFTPDDFCHMTAPLLYEMFKAKTEYILHASVRLKREDVLFLFLVEFASQLPSLLDRSDNLGRIALDLALESKQEIIARTLLEHGASVDAITSGTSLLHAALQRGDDFAASFLLKNHAKVNLVSQPSGQLPLHVIASQCYQDEETRFKMTLIGEDMLRLGADPNIQDSERKTCLHLSVAYSNRPLFTCLVNYEGIKVDLRDKDDLPPLWYALVALEKDANSLEEDSYASALIAKGASVDAKMQKDANTLLHLLAKEGYERAGKFLVLKGAETGPVNSNGETPLHLSCRSGLAGLTTALLKAGADPNRQTYLMSFTDNPFDETKQEIYRESALHVALRNQHFDDVSAILEHIDSSSNQIPDLNLEDSVGLTPFGVALKDEQFDVALTFLQKGANINQLNPKGYSLLHSAILEGMIVVALFLLDNNADPNFKTRDGVTPLELCIEKNLPLIVESLCEKGCDLTPSNSIKSSPLWLALQPEEMGIAEILVKYNADVNSWEEGPEGCHQTLLHRAIDENREDIACFLIENGSLVDALRREGPTTGLGVEVVKEKQTPLHMCCSWGLIQTTKSLIAFGAKINVKDADGKTPFHLALENGHLELISLFLDQCDLDLGIRDKEGRTPFATAMMNKNNKAAQAILHKHPAAAEQHDNKGFNFLHTAIQKGDLESVLFLLSISVNLTSKTKDERRLSPLHLATLQGNEMILRNLILARAKLNEITPQKQTCLHLAALRDHAQLCSILIQNSINVDALDDNLNNALHVAVKEGHLATVRVLLTESRINEVAINLRGQNPLHVLASYPKENAAAIFNVILEAIPNYPINETDVDGNSVLLLAYIRGAGQLCRSLVRAGACLGACNKQNIHIFNYEVATKKLLCRLLDSLQTEPPWSECDFCLECGVRFSIATRRHHCRHCGRSLCGKCSAKEVPIIKFGVNKPVRVCQMCFDILTIGTSAYS